MRLRAIEPEDLDFLYTIENDSDMWDVGVANTPYSHFLLNKYLLSCSSDIYADRQMRLVMETEKGTPVGLLDIFNFEPQHLRADLGIAVLRSERNHGYGLEAVKLAVEYAKNVLHLHQLCAVVAHNNKPSLKLFHDAGFQDNALLKDWIFDGKEYHDASLMQIFL
jgi:diamine N-acetyltransferase